MSASYTYDPEQINYYGRNRMRFELGDTIVDGGRETCPLCDEEYDAVISRCASEKKTWDDTKLECLSAIMMKMSYEVDYSADGMSLSLSKRYDRWKALYDEMKAKQDRGKNAPVAWFCGPNASNISSNKPYFTFGMHDNPQAGDTSCGHGWDV